MRYTTLALKPATKKRLERLRRARGFSSMDAFAQAWAAELELQETLDRIRRSASGWEKTVKSGRFQELEEALEGLEDSVKRSRASWRKRRKQLG